jgi:hypothetical protein
VYLLNGEDGGISISNFRYWKIPPGLRLLHGRRRRQEELDPGCHPYLAGRVDGCLYMGKMWGVLMVRDNASLEFCEVDLPSCIKRFSTTDRSFIIVHGDFGSRIVQVYRDEVDVFGRAHGSGKWVHVRSVRLLPRVIRRLSKFPAEEPFYRWGIRVFSDGPGFVVLLAQDCERRSRWLLSVDVETMEMKAVTESAYHKTRRTWSYASSIRECLSV